MDPIVIGAIAAIVIGVPIALGVRSWLDARRGGQMEALARPLGMRYVDRDEQLAHSQLSRLPLFRDGQDPSYLHVLRGTFEDGEMLVFDLRQRMGSALGLLTQNSPVADMVRGVRNNRAPSYYNMTVVAFRLPGRRLHSFTLRNGKVIEGAPAQDAPGCLRGLSGHVHAEGHGEWLCVYRFDQQVPIDDLTAFVGRARRFARAFTGDQAEAGAQIRSPLGGLNAA